MKRWSYEPGDFISLIKLWPFKEVSQLINNALYNRLEFLHFDQSSQIICNTFQTRSSVKHLVGRHKMFATVINKMFCPQSSIGLPKLNLSYFATIDERAMASPKV